MIPAGATRVLLPIVLAVVSFAGCGGGADPSASIEPPAEAASPDLRLDDAAVGSAGTLAIDGDAVDGGAPAAATDEGGAGPVDYADTIRQFREERERRLLRADGWLAVVGLYRLGEGDNAFGGDESLSIPLPVGDAPPRTGTLRLDGDRIWARAEPDVGIAIDGEGIEVQEREVVEGKDGRPPVIGVGRFRLEVLVRAEPPAVRVRDPEGPARASFGGLRYFPVDERWRAPARFEPYGRPQTRSLATVDGGSVTLHAPGRLRFRLEGRDFEMEALAYAPDERSIFFLMFRDRTNGDSTFHAGRYLHTERDGEAFVIDFNKAYSPPCAFTRWAVCPLPPTKSEIGLEVRAGEKFPPNESRDPTASAPSEPGETRS